MAVTTPPRVDWFRIAPFLLLHVACLSVFWVGWSWTAVGVAACTYFARVFGLTAFYHRYFSHRSFKTSRWIQFLGALLGSSAGQRGPIWWAAHHRTHHRHSDTEHDVHSPRQHGFWWSHMFWFTTPEAFTTDKRLVKDWLRFPELRLVDRLDFFAPLALAGGMFALGRLLEHGFPSLGVTGLQMLVWGFLISTILLYHVTYAINSIAHKVGTRRFETRDDSRNNLVLAMITFGEGWHNNHHHYPNSVRQGFYWWEIDMTYWILVVMSWLGLVWGLKPVPVRVLKKGRRS